MGARHILEDGIQDLFLDLCDGVTVEDLHGDLWAVSVIWTDTAQDLRVAGRGHTGEDSGKNSRSQQHPGILREWLLSMMDYGGSG